MLVDKIFKRSSGKNTFYAFRRIARQHLKNASPAVFGRY